MVRRNREAQRVATLLAEALARQRDVGLDRLMVLVRRQAASCRLGAADTAELQGMLKRRAALATRAQMCRNLATTLELQTERLTSTPVLRAALGALTSANNTERASRATHAMLTHAVLRSAEAERALCEETAREDNEEGVEVNWSEAIAELLPGVPMEEPRWPADTRALLRATTAVACAAPRSGDAEVVMMFSHERDARGLAQGQE